MKSWVSLNSARLHHLTSQMEYLGEGVDGVVGRIPWRGGFAILKTMRYASPRAFKTELSIMKRLDGAGGAPKVLGVCNNPRAIVMSSRGEIPLSDALWSNLPDWYLICIVLKVGQRLREVHERGVIHGDIHTSNVMVTLSPDFCKPPEVFLIDFGLSTLSPKALADVGDTQMIKKDLTLDVKQLGEMLLDIFKTMKMRRRSIQKSIRSVIEMARPLEGEPAALDDVLQKLNSVLTDDFHINLPGAPHPRSGRCPAASSSRLLLKHEGPQRHSHT